MGKILSAFVQTNSPFFTKVKSADETRVSDTTLTADSELKFKAKANKTYFIKTSIFLTSHGTPDFKDALIIPALATADRNDGDWSSTLDQAIADWEVGLVNQTTTGQLAVLSTFGRVVMGSTAGEISYAWAQNTSSVEDTIVNAGSFIEVYES